MPRVLTTAGEELGFVDGTPAPGSELTTLTPWGEQFWLVQRQRWRIVGAASQDVGRCVAIIVRAADSPEMLGCPRCPPGMCVHVDNRPTGSKPQATAAHTEAKPPLRVLFDRVLVTTIKPDEGALRGVVRAVGPGVTDVRPGEIVYFGKYSGIEVCLPGASADPCRPCRVMRQDDIFFVVEKL